MGEFAFSTAPEHAGIYARIKHPPLPTIIGLRDRWDMPLVRHRAVLKAGSRFIGVPHFVLTYQIAGAAVRRTDRADLKTVARTGAISLQTPGSAGTFESEGGNRVEYAHLYFNEAVLHRVADRSALAPPTEDFFGLIDVNLQRDIVAYLERAQDNRCPPTTVEMDFRAQVVLFGLLRASATAGARVAGAAGLSDRQLQKLEEAVLARLCDTIRLADLAEVAGMSVYHFARLFKRTTGETPNGFVMRIRMEQALEMLRETNLPVTEVAFRTGFSSQSHLSRRLQAAYGKTPGKLRQTAL